MRRYIKKIKPKYIIHCAGLSRPMDLHVKNINKSINLNIIGTANVVNICSEFNIKLIYFSTGYVYDGKKGNYSENDPLLPINNYAWSKLGGECSVVLYKKSLILRIMMCERPFLHDHAFYDIKTNFMFQDEVAKIIPKILDKKGIINIGGKIQSVYDFAKKTKKDVLKIKVDPDRLRPIDADLQVPDIEKFKKHICYMLVYFEQNKLNILSTSKYILENRKLFIVRQIVLLYVLVYLKS